MRILTSVCFTAILFPISGLNALANPVEKSPASASPTRTGEWKTEATALTPLVAQKSSSSTSETVTADNAWTKSESVERQEVEDVLGDLNRIGGQNFLPNRGSPGFTIGVPSGFGADRNRFYSGLSFQSDTRYGGNSDADATMGFGVGLGNAQKAVGVELTYTLASFGNNLDFGSGGFSTKIHRQFDDSLSVAAGWNGFITIGQEDDFKDSLYLAGTKIFRTRENLDSPFSRVALTLGVGNGQFRTEDSVTNDENTFNPFASLSFRVARPMSAIVEWTGQDLAVGTSVSPFRRIPLTVNLAVRDIVGAGDGARLVGGIGASF
jgi:hypothetical protein